MQKILIAPMTLASQEGEYQRSLREAGFELVYPSRATQLIEEELLRAIQGVKGALAGLGRIGKAVACRGESFGMRLLAHEPLADQAFVAQHQITLAPFDQLLAESDYLTLHVPLSAETRHLINRRTLALMKPTAFL